MNRFYIEIGTCDFDILNERYKESPVWEGLSIEPVKEHYDRLEKYDKNVYRNLAVVGSSNPPDTLPIYTVASKTIQKHGLPIWLRGCSALSQNNVSLLKYKEHVTKEEVKTISVERLFKNTKCHVDLLKVDTEGEDYNIVKQVLTLGYRPTHMIFETCFVVDHEIYDLYELLRKNHYTFIKRRGDSIQFSRPSVLLIADANWSTGSISKDLQHLSKVWQVSIYDWKDYNYTVDLKQIFSEFDSVICFTLNASLQWPILANHSVVCCGEVEISNTIPHARAYGTVSPTIYEKLTKMSSHPIFYTPASARIYRFPPYVSPKHIIPTILGFVGPTTIPSVKNYQLFKEICEKTNCNPRIAFKDYTYENMYEFYRSIDFLICTSTSEGGPLPVFEAISAGVPVVSTNVGLTKEMSTIANFQTADQAVDLIKSITKNLDTLMSYRDAQYKEFCKKFSMETFLPYWVNFFEGSRHQTTVVI